jgi:teichuronic acid biosynthesis glycosyltransferase TuaG
MPCRNGAKFLREAIESVRAQTVPSWQLLVVDNGSTDGSQRIVEEFSAIDRRVISLSTKVPGAAAARNVGIDAASGRLIAFLDCDDRWAPQKLERQIGRIERDDLAFCWSAYEVVNANGEKIRDQAASEYVTYGDLLRKRAVIGCLTAIYDTQLLGKQFMPDIRMRQDYALWLRLLKMSQSLGYSCAGVTESLAQYRVHDAGMTRNKLRAAFYQWRVYRDVEKLPVLESLSCMVAYLGGAVADRLIAPKSM